VSVQRAVAPSICLPPAPWTERDRWGDWRLENWIREAQEWSQSAERWRKRSLLAWLLLALYARQTGQAGEGVVR